MSGNFFINLQQIFHFPNSKLQNSAQSINGENTEVQTFMEAFPLGAGAKKRTFVNLSRKDDMKRRASIAAISIAKHKNDPLFEKWARYRVKERQYRKLIFKKYSKQAYKVARRSQKKHLAERKRFPALPIFGKKN